MNSSSKFFRVLAGVMLIAGMPADSARGRIEAQSQLQPVQPQQGQQPQSQAAQTQLPALPVPIPGFGLPARQTLNYSVDWRVFTAGSVVMKLEAQGEDQHVSVTADSVGAVNLLFPVVDKFQSVFNRRTGCSSSFAKQTQEGRRKISSELKFDYAQGKQLLAERNLVKGTSKQQEAAIPACVTDVLSAIFYTASQPMTVGKSFQFPLADAMRNVAVTMKVEAKEEIKTPAGTFQTVRVEPTADAGIVKNRGNIWIWYTDDQRHLPVQMRARLLFGTLTLHLTSVEDK